MVPSPSPERLRGVADHVPEEQVGEAATGVPPPDEETVTLTVPLPPPQVPATVMAD
jgi:hypothetical protein